MIEVLLLLAIVGIVVFIVVVLYLFKKRFKIAFLMAIAYVVIGALSFLASVWYVDKVCGPNPKDVAIMKPMAKKISEYIIKNGIPKSLKDIPGLPYELECSQEDGNSCYFKVNSNRYSVAAIKTGDNDPMYNYRIALFSSPTRTGFGVYFKKDIENKYIITNKYGGAYSMKNTGICSTMKQ